MKTWQRLRRVKFRSSTKLRFWMTMRWACSEVPLGSSQGNQGLRPVRRDSGEHSLAYLRFRDLLADEGDFARAFFCTRIFHAASKAPLNRSSFVADSGTCVAPLLPQPPATGMKMFGNSATKSACTSGVSIRLPYP